MNNESFYFSLNSKNLSESSEAHNLKFTCENVSLEDYENYIIDSTIQKERISGIDRIQNMVTDSNGLLYILDDCANIWQYDYRRNQKELIIKQGNGWFANEARLSYCEGIIYIADMSSQNRITAFSINEGSLLWTVNEIDGLPLFPLDIATDEYNNLYALVPLSLAKISEQEYTVREDGVLGIVRINEHGEGVEICRYEALKLFAGKKTAQLKNIFCLETSGKGEIFVLSSQAKEIYTFNQDGMLQSRYNLKEPAFPSDLAVDINNSILVSDMQVINDKGNYSSSIFRYDKAGSPGGHITGITSGISHIILDKNNNIFALDKTGSTITVLMLKKQMKESGIYKSTYGTLITCSLDSTTDETNWHKYVLDAYIPEGTQLKVSYFARDSKVLTIDNNKVDIDDFIKDSTITFEHKLLILDRYWTKPQISPQNSLINESNGRYLWLKIEFSGSKENTPLLNRIRIYNPRISYLRYLPLVYQENNESRDFLERYLSIFETLFSAVNEEIVNISRYFDVDYVSGSFLKWLAGWVEIAAGDEWEDDKLRELIKNAVDIYKRRGTAGSLEKIIEIFTGEKPIIIESFMLDKMIKEPDIREMFSKLYGMENNSFCVLIRSQAIKGVKQQAEIERIIDREKPAFTEAKLIILPSHVRLDMHSYLGLNSYLSEVSLLHLNGKSVISNDTAIID
ncbi:MAG: phage tail protein [Bacillota bacterium]